VAGDGKSIQSTKAFSTNFGKLAYWKTTTVQEKPKAVVLFIFYYFFTMNF